MDKEVEKKIKELEQRIKWLEDKIDIVETGAGDRRPYVYLHRGFTYKGEE